MTMEQTNPLKVLAIGVAALVSLSAQAASQTFTGVVTDGICAVDGHASMRMGPTDAECARACADAHEARFVLVVGATVYALSDQRTSEKFAAQPVTVTGTLDATTRTIQVESIAAAP